VNGMNVARLLQRNKERIVTRWLDEIFASYHKDSRGFLQTQKDRFNNPLGVTMTEAITSLYDEIATEGGGDRDTITSCLDRIIRVRAVQDLSCEEALQFIFQLKHVVRDVLNQEIKEHMRTESLNDFDTVIDELALRAFAVYAGVREDLHHIRLREYKRMYARILERYHRLSDPTGPEHTPIPVPVSGNISEPKQ